MTRRYTGGFLSSTEQATDANSANGIFTLSEAAEKTALGNFPTGRWTPQRSLRFRSDAYQFLSRTPTTAGNRQIWTYSLWIKRSKFGVLQKILEAGDVSSDYLTILFNGPGSGSVDDRLSIYSNISSVQSIYVETTAVYRDPSAWYHIVVAIDTTQAVASNRVRIYVNGSQVTSLAATNYPAQNSNQSVNNTVTHCIGPTISTYYMDCHVANINLIDGQALTASSFGQTDAATGAWIPKQYTGTYGTNGFFLPLDPNYNPSPGSTFNADFVVVAGGGGGSNGYGAPGPGGGAGGFRTSAGTSGAGAAAESSIGLNLSTAYSIIVGAGGTGGTGASGIASKGSISRFSNIISFGGGAGYSPGITDNWTVRTLGQGGSGSGGDTTTPAYGTLGQGSNGGLSRNGSGGLNSGDGYNGGGGGGASASGANSTSGSAGAGGNGQATSISGSSVTYGGGGAGANDSARVNGPASGGTGGGGSSVYGAAGNNGSTNTGGGGAGGSNRAGAGGSGYAGGNGGSGIVIIKIPNTYTATFSGGVTSSLSTSVSGYKIYTVTATSTTSETVTFS